MKYAEPFSFETPRSFVPVEEARAIAAGLLTILKTLEASKMPDGAGVSHHGLSELLRARWHLTICEPNRQFKPTDAMRVQIRCDDPISRSSWKRVIRAIVEVTGPTLEQHADRTEAWCVVARATPPNLVQALQNRDQEIQQSNSAGFERGKSQLVFNDWWNTVYARPHGAREREVSSSYARYRAKAKRAKKGTTLAPATDLREPVAGEYWRITDPGSASDRLLSYVQFRSGGYPDDPILLVAEVRNVGSSVHSVVLKKHPRAYVYGDLALPISEFRAHFAFAPDGADVRAREQAELDREVHDLSEQAQRGPSNDELLALPAGIEDEFATSESDVDRAAATLDAQVALPSGDAQTKLPAPLQRAALRLEQARGELVIARRRGLWIKAITDRIGQRSADLAAFHEERAVAVIASLSDVRTLVKNLARGVTSLSLYSGEAVEVEALRQGIGAEPEEPLHLIQARLHLDEEYLAHLSTGGADWADWDDFVDALDDRALLDRILPFPRCVALMRYRRNDKTYYVPSKHANMFELMGVAQANHEANAENRESFLLIRNGENVYRVFSPIGTSSAPRLFPQTDELQKPFHGYDGSELDFGDVRYFEATEKSEETALFYRRLLILMWGLQDRLGIFGEFYDREQYGEIGFMDIRLQHDRFRFIYDDEDGFALGDGSDTFATWIRARNAQIAPGSRVIARWEAIMSSETCPTAFYRGNSSDVMKLRPVEKVGLGIVHKRKATLCVDCDVFDRYDDDTSKRVHIALDNQAVLFRGSLNALVLDGVRVADLDRLLHSRVARREYLAFAELFIEARKLLVAEETALAPLEEQICGELEAANLVTEKASGAEAAAEAIRLWRLGHAGAMPDAEALEAIRSIAFSLVTDSIDYASLEAAVRSLGAEPIVVLKNAEGKLVVLRSKLETEALGYNLPDPWIVRSRIEHRRGTWTFGTPDFVLPHAAVRAHKQLHSWKAIDSESPSRHPRVTPNRSHARRWTKILAAPELDVNAKLLLGNEAALRAALGSDPVEHLCRLTRSLGRRSTIRRPLVTLPIAVVRYHDSYHDADTGLFEDYRVLFATRELWALMYEHGTARERREIEAFWNDYAVRPAHHLEIIRTRRVELGLTDIEMTVPPLSDLLTHRARPVRYTSVDLKGLSPSAFTRAFIAGKRRLGQHDVVSLVHDAAAELLEKALQSMETEAEEAEEIDV